MAGISGVTLLDDVDNVRSVFNRTNSNTWMVFKFKDDKNLKGCLKGAEWNQMVDSLPKDDVRYGICNFTYVSPTDQVTRSKSIFVMWAPDGAPVKEKLKAAMYCRQVKTLLATGSSFHVSMQANELADLDNNVLMECIRRNCSVV